MSGAAFGIKRDTVATIARCPDCLSETRTVEVAPHIYTVQVFHDDTCPYLAARKH